MRNIWKISLYLSHALFLLRNLRKRIKRESGANPGQSRCCKLQNGLGNSFMPLTRVGKALIPEVSQKTLQRIFFDGLRRIGRKRTVNRSRFLRLLFVSRSYLLVFNYFAIIPGKRGMNLCGRMRLRLDSCFPFYECGINLSGFCRINLFPRTFVRFSIKRGR